MWCRKAVWGAVKTDNEGQTLTGILGGGSGWTAFGGNLSRGLTMSREEGRGGGRRDGVKIEEE